MKAKQKDPAIRRAVTKAGSQSQLARDLGVSQAAVNYWCAGKKLVAPQHWRRLEALYQIPALEFAGDAMDLLARRAD